MFYSITGTIVNVDANSIAVSCGGVAFRIGTSLNTLQKSGRVGNEITLYTYLSVQDDALELFGFGTTDELDFFKMLMKVQNVGPKSALSILSVHTTESLILAIAAGDAKSIAKAQGIGAKTAQRIILELRDKVTKMVPDEVSASSYQTSVSPFTGNIPEAQSALVSLGYSASDASKALAGLDSSLPVEDLIRAAFKKLV